MKSPRSRWHWGWSCWSLWSIWLCSAFLAGCGGTPASLTDGGGPRGTDGAVGTGVDGGLIVPSVGHTATLLPNGNVLIAGGQTADWKTHPGAALFDPSTNTWSATAPLQVERMNHTATWLPDGRVLVVGGTNYPTPRLASCELYDPAKGTWTRAADLPLGRKFHTATLLLDGRVLVTGGYDVVDAIDRADLYDPATDTWQAAPPLSTPRVFHRAILLLDGRVLVAGGSSTYQTNVDYLDSAELFDPVTNAWTSTARMLSKRHYFAAERLPNGNVLVVGGQVPSQGTVATAEEYQVGDGTWRSLPPMTKPRKQHAILALPERGILVAGGLASGEGYTKVEIFEAATQTWLPLDTAAPHAESSMTWLPDGRILFAGGQDGNGQVMATWEVFALP
jgi:hypothetical protein